MKDVEWMKGGERSGGRPAVVAMTIAGSDSGGGAGVQADLKTFAAFGVFGTSVVTCLTAQNPGGVFGVEGVSGGFVLEQIRAVIDGFSISVVKTGMLWSAEVVDAIAGALDGLGVPVVVDPVMIATSGAELLRRVAMETMKRRLLPLATVITPNADEAELLADMRVKDLAGMREAAIRISGKFGAACVVKGGHIAGGGDVIDVLCEGEELSEFAVRRVTAVGTHGTGCTFSAALGALLAKGIGVGEAVKEAQAYVGRCLRDTRSAGKHGVLGWGNY